jgi:DNA-binding transcriptional LysR family regulator
MNINLTTELLRNLVAIVDAGSMSKASSEVNITQSALSLQMKRLSDMVGMPIFDRHHRGVTLTPAGKTLLAYAREMIELNDRAIASIVGGNSAEPIRIGVVDSGEAILTQVLPQIMHANPRAELRVGVGSSTELVSQLSGGVHDIVVCLGEPNDRACVVSARMVWLGHPQLRHEAELPLVLLRKPCIYRDAAIESLESVGRPYRIVLEAPSVFVLRAAVLGGIGLTCRSGPFYHGSLPVLDDLAAPLPRVGYCVQVSSIPSLAVQRTARLIRSAIRRFASEDPNFQPGIL